jgi:hypothetical protein
MAPRKKKRELSLEKLAQLAKEGVERKPLLSRMELENEEKARELTQRLMEEKLAALPPENDKPKACPLCGQKVPVRVRLVERTFKSLSGMHSIRRHYHYCDRCKEGFFPRDNFLGLPKHGDLSEELEARVADFAVNDTYELGQERWNFHYRDLPLSTNQFRQVAKRMGQSVEETNPVVLHGALLSPPFEAAQTLYVMNDGGMVPMRGGLWNEVKVGVLFRAEDHLSNREVPRGALTRARYVGVLGEQEEFKNDLSAAFAVENGSGAKRVVWLADGAIGNWTLAGFIAPNAIQILDWIHALEHGINCGKALLGEGDAALPTWKKRIEDLLWAGDVEALVCELNECRDGATSQGIKAIDELVAYYRSNAKRMQYARFVSEGLLIGSGIVESAHRHVIQARMKRAGQHWGRKGGRQMARLRAAYRTAGPDKFYAAIRWAHRQSTHARLPLRPVRRRASNL